MLEPCNRFHNLLGIEYLILFEEWKHKQWMKRIKTGATKKKKNQLLLFLEEKSLLIILHWFDWWTQKASKTQSISILRFLIVFISLACCVPAAAGFFIVFQPTPATSRQNDVMWENNIFWLRIVQASVYWTMWHDTSSFKRISLKRELNEIFLSIFSSTKMFIKKTSIVRSIINLIQN